MIYPRFKKDGECVKCGSNSIGIRYIYESKVPPSNEDLEYLSRKCCICGYSWNEMCLDYLDKSVKRVKKDLDYRAGGVQLEGGY